MKGKYIDTSSEEGIEETKRRIKEILRIAEEELRSY